MTVVGHVQAWHPTQLHFGACMNWSLWGCLGFGTDIAGGHSEVVSIIMDEMCPIGQLDMGCASDWQSCIAIVWDQMQAKL